MTIANRNRGGAPVGHIADLDAVEAAAVMYFRLWCDGPEAQARVRSEFLAALGADHGQSAFRSFEHLCDLCVRLGRRPLMRHDLTCQCLGADEACFATFVAAATASDREDAFLIATILVRADVAICLIDHAQAFGLALKRMALRSALPMPMPRHQSTFH